MTRMKPEELEKLRTDPFILDERPDLLDSLWEATRSRDGMAENMGKSGSVRWPLSFQFRTLGIDRGTLEGLKGKRVLDVGCGQNYDLVSYLRSVGVEAEGIDPALTANEPWLIKQGVYGLGSMEGAIPRPDKHYSLVLMHSNVILIKGFHSQCDSSDQIIRSNFAVVDSMRVLKDEGKFICWPGLEKTAGLEFFACSEGWKIGREPTLNAQMPVIPGYEHCKYRTVISKEAKR